MIYLYLFANILITVLATIALLFIANRVFNKRKREEQKVKQMIRSGNLNREEAEDLLTAVSLISPLSPKGNQYLDRFIRVLLVVFFILMVKEMISPLMFILKSQEAADLNYNFSPGSFMAMSGMAGELIEIPKIMNIFYCSLIVIYVIALISIVLAFFRINSGRFLLAGFLLLLPAFSGLSAIVVVPFILLILFFPGSEFCFKTSKISRKWNFVFLFLPLLIMAYPTYGIINGTTTYIIPGNLFGGFFPGGGINFITTSSDYSNVSFSNDIIIPRKNFCIMIMDTEPFSAEIAPELKKRLLDSGIAEHVTIAHPGIIFGKGEISPDYFLQIRTTTMHKPSMVYSKVHIFGSNYGLRAENSGLKATLFDEGHKLSFNSVANITNVNSAAIPQKELINPILDKMFPGMKNALKGINDNALPEALVKELTPEFGKQIYLDFPEHIPMKMFYAKSGFGYNDMTLYYTIVPSPEAENLQNELEEILAQKFDRSSSILYFVSSLHIGDGAWEKPADEKNMNSYLVVRLYRRTLDLKTLKEKLFEYDQFLPYIPIIVDKLTAGEIDSILDNDGTVNALDFNSFHRLLLVDANAERKARLLQKYWNKKEFNPNERYSLLRMAEDENIPALKEYIETFWGTELPFGDPEKEFAIDAEPDQYITFHTILPEELDGRTIRGWAILNFNDKDRTIKLTLGCTSPHMGGTHGSITYNVNEDNSLSAEGSSAFPISIWIYSDYFSAKPEFDGKQWKIKIRIKTPMEIGVFESKHHSHK